MYAFSIKTMLVHFLLTHKTNKKTMKQKINSTFKGTLLAAMAVTVIFAGCQKGDTGPAGPQGADGNANVIGEDAVQISYSDWQITGSDYTVQIPDNNITSDIVSNGLVEVYKQYGSSWTNLPDIVYITSTVFTSTVYNFYAGVVQIYVQNSDGSIPINPGAQVFRIVVIPSSQRKANPNANWSNYNEAMSIINASKAVQGSIKQTQ